jgi:hypothetical protein
MAESCIFMHESCKTVVHYSAMVLAPAETGMEKNSAKLRWSRYPQFLKERSQQTQASRF